MSSRPPPPSPIPVFTEEGSDGVESTLFEFTNAASELHFDPPAGNCHSDIDSLADTEWFTNPPNPHTLDPVPCAAPASELTAASPLLTPEPKANTAPNAAIFTPLFATNHNYVFSPMVGRAADEPPIEFAPPPNDDEEEEQFDEDDVHGEEEEEEKEEEGTQNSGKPAKCKRSKDKEPSELHMLEESEDEAFDAEDLAFFNDDDPHKDVVPETEPDISEKNILPLPVANEEGLRRSFRKRKVPEFYGLEEEIALFAKMEEDLLYDCTRYNETIDLDDDDTHSASPAAAATAAAAAAPTAVNDSADSESNYVPSELSDGEESGSTEDTEDDCDSAMCVLIDLTPTNKVCFRVIDANGYILEASEDCLNAEEMRAAITLTVDSDTWFVTREGEAGRLAAARFYTEFVHPCDDTAEVDASALSAFVHNTVLERDFEGEEWWETVGAIFFTRNTR